MTINDNVFDKKDFSFRISYNAFHFNKLDKNLDFFREAIVHYYESEYSKMKEL